ncbi:hypothetical protein GCM10010302_32210 [Streptomyces polychromogenes]|uniref:Uncharacterized protein n=1 Tax=Streptomyces polychromogenes TaxID=67342 RepID=A0ABN0VEI3_9ACTN
MGAFNDWRPGAYLLVPHTDGIRTVTVNLPAKSGHAFCYLGDSDHRFEEARRPPRRANHVLHNT